MDTKDIIALGKQLEEKSKVEQEVRDLKSEEAQLKQSIGVLKKARDGEKETFEKEKNMYLKQIQDIKNSAIILEKSRQEATSKLSSKASELMARENNIKSDEADLARKKNDFAIQEQKQKKELDEINRQKNIVKQIGILSNQL